MAKVALEIKKAPQAPNSKIQHKYVRKMLPYFRSNLGVVKYTHRIRSAKRHFKDGNHTHTSMVFYCGNSGFVHKGELSSDEPKDLCPRCEAAMERAGVDIIKIGDTDE